MGQELHNPKSSTVKGQKLRLCLQSLIFLSPRRVSPFSHGVIFTRASISLALLSLRENEGLLIVYQSVMYPTWSE